MSRLHLHPVPDATVVAFPAAANTTPDVVLRQLANIQAHIAQRRGALLGRMIFAEAAVWQIALSAAEAEAVVATRTWLLEEFEGAVACAGTMGFGLPEAQDGRPLG